MQIEDFLIVVNLIFVVFVVVIFFFVVMFFFFNFIGSYIFNGIKVGVIGDDFLFFFEGYIGWYYGKLFLGGIYVCINNLKIGM